VKELKDIVEKVFPPGGTLSRLHPGYEFRPGQIEMAKAVAEALESGRHLIVEAGTGTGKTLAYLVPAIAAAIKGRKRILISTGTKNLQEQLMEKDLPFLSKLFGGKFTASYMKGRGNYLCLFRLEKAEQQPILDGLEQLSQFDSVRQWAKETKNGDRSELDYLPEDISFWSRINARSEVCLGQKCPDFERCFITRMRAKAIESDIVVVNHHLFFADLSLKGSNFGRVLPDYSAVIFDEAHLIEEVASDYFGIAVTNFQLNELARDYLNLFSKDSPEFRNASKKAEKLLGLGDKFFISAASLKSDGRQTLNPNRFKQNNNYKSGLNNAAAALTELFAVLSDIIQLLEPKSDDSPEFENILRRFREFRFSLNFVVNQEEKEFVYWVERSGRTLRLGATPIDVSGILVEKLFEKTDSCILTSATLSSAGSFDYIRNRLGLNDSKVMTMTAASSFDYESQCLMYLPDGMPDPRLPEFGEAAAREIANILKMTHGRAFVLCTSNQSMNTLYELVSSKVNFNCLLQGTRSKKALLNEFKSVAGSVLFATASFWQGIDVQGEMLSCVIIDKLPFSVPTDPVIAARIGAIESAGGNAFLEFSVPEAVIQLKQGVGRLIRSRLDRGVIAILDPRIRTKTYGRYFLQSLPKMPITTKLSDISQVFEEIEKIS
jgi:ATP-dependent DNA helicase DinG